VTARVADRTILYAGVVMFGLWLLVPFALIVVSALTPQAQVSTYPKPLVPSALSTATLQSFLESGGVIASIVNSLLVAILAIAFAVGLGAPAGYALARFSFRGRSVLQAAVLAAKLFPIAILAIPLAVVFSQLGLYDNLVGVALVHGAIALPFVCLIVGGAFARTGADLEDAAQTLGTGPFGAFVRVALPPAVPSLVAAAILTFVISWNEVFAASILTVRVRTLPAQVFASLSTSPLGFKFAAAVVMAAPAIVLIFAIREYLKRVWGSRG
jgi:multiple sugar transport system permease protein